MEQFPASSIFPDTFSDERTAWPFSTQLKMSELLRVEWIRHVSPPPSVRSNYQNVSQPPVERYIKCPRRTHDLAIFHPISIKKTI